jgi:hypothetical protein
MALSRPVGRQHNKLDTIRLNKTFFQCADDLVITPRER